MIDFAAIRMTPDDEHSLIEIADRARLLGVQRDRIDLMMDLQVAHSTCPLELYDLADANQGDFLHDICGIVANLNRETGELENCFVPRFAKH